MKLLSSINSLQKLFVLWCLRGIICDKHLKEVVVLSFVFIGISECPKYERSDEIDRINCEALSELRLNFLLSYELKN